MSCVCKAKCYTVSYLVVSLLDLQCFSHTQKAELEDTTPNEKRERANESHMKKETLYFDIVNHKYICHGTQLNSFPSEKEDFVFGNGSSSSNFLSFATFYLQNFPVKHFVDAIPYCLERCVFVLRIGLTCSFVIVIVVVLVVALCALYLLFGWSFSQWKFSQNMNMHAENETNKYMHSFE